MSGRFSPPQDKVDLLKELVGKGSPFNEYRDVVFFAAVVGYREGRRVPLGTKGEAIRWDVMSNRFATENIMDMIAISQSPDDKELLSEVRQPERVAILEEYANGGLEVIRERLTLAGAVPLQTFFVDLIQRYLDDGDSSGSHENLADKVLNL